MENARINQKYKVAVVGKNELALGFRLSGIPESYQVDDTEDTEKALREIMQKEDIGLVIISSSLIHKIKDRKILNAIESSISPIFVEIPGYRDEKGADTLRKLIIRAIGIDIAAKKS